MAYMLKAIKFFEYLKYYNKLVIKDQSKIIISKKIKRNINRVLLKNTLNSYFL